MITDDIALTLHPGLGSKTAAALMECFGSAEKLFAAGADAIAACTRLKPAQIKSLARREFHSAAEKELEFIRKHKIRAIAWDSPEYPAGLRECADRPQVIYAKGPVDFNTGHWLSVVGTRNITSYGLNVCDVLIRQLQEMFPDLVVVSGLAYGVDIAAHRAAMRYGAKTVGVVAHPLTHIYPPGHTEAARRIATEGGAVVSEYTTGCNPDKSGFVQRNRIVAGLSAGTLIVESAARGGSLITADLPFSYDREVMAVPGRIGDKFSEGTNKLIGTTKAALVSSAEEIANSLNWTVPAAAPKTQGTETPSLFGSDSENRSVQERILALIGDEAPVSFEEISQKAQLPVQELSTIVFELEFSGKIRPMPGKMYLKIPGNDR